MTMLTLRHDGPQGPTYGYPSLSGWILLVFGAGGIAVLFKLGTLETKALWIGSLLLALVGLAGLYGVLRRFDLTLDMVARRYRGRRGMWPNPEPFEGSFDDLREVTLDIRWVRSRGQRDSHQERAQWRVALVVGGWDKPVGLLATHDEGKAFRRFEELAKRLRLCAVDRTGEEEIRRPWEELDVAIPQMTPSPQDEVELTAPPEGCGAEVGFGPEGRVILLPKLGIAGAGWIGVLFTGSFAVIGMLGLLSFLGVVPLEIQADSQLEGIAISSVFLVLGLLLTTAVIAGSQTRERIEERGSELVISSQLGARQLRPKRLAKAEIEAVEVRGGTSRSGRGWVRVGNTTYGPKPEKGSEGGELFIRTDAEIVRLGKDLSPEVRGWLCRAVTAMVQGASSRYS